MHKKILLVLIFVYIGNLFAFTFPYAKNVKHFSVDYSKPATNGNKKYSNYFTVKYSYQNKFTSMWEYGLRFYEVQIINDNKLIDKAKTYGGEVGYRFWLFTIKNYVNLTLGTGLFYEYYNINFNSGSTQPNNPATTSMSHILGAYVSPKIDVSLWLISIYSELNCQLGYGLNNNNKYSSSGFNSDRLEFIPAFGLQFNW